MILTDVYVLVPSPKNEKIGPSALVTEIMTQ